MAEYINVCERPPITQGIKGGEKSICWSCFHWAVCFAKENQPCIKCSRYIPAADVRPVKRGRWKPHDLTWGRSYYYCTACEKTVDMPTEMGVPIYKYCPFCGAKQEEEK